MKRVAVAIACAASLAASAGDFPSAGSLAQAQFESLAKDLGAAFSYKGVTPATQLGPLGFDVGLEATNTSIESVDAFRLAGAGSPSSITIPKLHVYKGLPGGFDIGAFIASAPEISASLFGADVRYAVVEDGITTPAVGVRLSGTKANGLGALKVTTAALDLVVSKRFLALTPYAGGGAVRTNASVGSSLLSEVAHTEGRYFAGLNLNLVAINVAIEAEKMGDNRSISAKFGLRF